MSAERFHLNQTEILVGSDAEEAMRIAAGQFAAAARKAVEGKSPFNVALSGGGTPRHLFQTLAAEPFCGLVPWSAIQFFWGDERNVPPNHPESNYAMARDLLLSRVPVPQSNVHRIPTGDGTALEAAELYERTLRERVPAANGMPRLDYVLLGLGENGHTASLFPNRPTLHEMEHLAVADHVDEVGAWRVTMTAPLLNNAAQVTFLVVGEAKAKVVHSILQGEHNPEAAPAQLIAPKNGALTWVLDAEAAAQLVRPERASPQKAG